MIITLTGKAAYKGKDYAVVETGGVGYCVFMSVPELDRIKVGESVKLWTHEYLRDDAREIYGFPDQPSLAMFDKLLAVSGVGPRMALNVLALGSVKEIERSIDAGDVDLLSRVPRVGKKTAQKIVLELKGKLVEPEAAPAEDEVVAALVKLGYARDQARDALSKVPARETDVKARLRAALRELGR